jgi:hypothetical protein
MAAVRFGPWAMADGETPNASQGDCAFFKQQGYDWIFNQVGMQPGSMSSSCWL